MNIALYAVFLLAAVSLPWWFVVPLGIVIATQPWGGPVAVLGGVLLDAMYGSPVATLGGFAHVYTLIFCIAVLGTWFLSSRVVDHDA